MALSLLEKVLQLQLGAWFFFNRSLIYQLFPHLKVGEVEVTGDIFVWPTLD